MEKRKKYLKPEAEVIEFLNSDIDTIAGSSIPDYPDDFGGFDEEEDF